MREIAVTFAELSRVPTYLDSLDLKTRASELTTEIASIDAELAPLLEEQAQAKRALASLVAENDVTRRDHSYKYAAALLRLQEADEAYKRLPLPDRTSPSYREGDDPKWLAYVAQGQAEKALKAIGVCPALAPTSEAEKRIRDAAYRIAPARARKEKLEDERKNLEDRIAEMTEGFPTALTEIDPAIFMSEAWTGGEISTTGDMDGEGNIRAAYVRGELDDTCPHCTGGHAIGTLTVGDIRFSVTFTDEVDHPLCYAKARFRAGLLDGAVPTKHAGHRVHSLKPWERSPIPAEEQKKIIARVPSTSEDLHGWLMVGPPGTSKTTYASAAITDFLTHRIAPHVDLYNSLEGFTLEALNYWRVKAPDWIRDNEAFERRDFHSDVPEPSVTRAKIQKASKDTGWPPILYIEELDKFNATKPRLDSLFALIDAVYEADGLIIAVANMTPVALKKHLGDAIFRRLVGDRDDRAKYKFQDFYAMAERKPSPAPTVTLNPSPTVTLDPART